MSNQGSGEGSLAHAKRFTSQSTARTTTSDEREITQRFHTFLETTLVENPLKGEYFLPLPVSQLIEEGKAIGESPVSIGVSCGSPMDSARGIIQEPPNLPGWKDVHITEELTARTGLPAFLCNDANACALAEWRFGAGRGTQNMIFCTFGTGFGAGLILDGKLYAGTNDNAGEIGHVRLDTEGPMGYYKIGSVEGFCSGGGIAKCGGYIAGRVDLVEKCSYRMTTPGLGREVGPSLGQTRGLFMGLFNAPHIVGEALKTAVFAASLFEQLGYETTPHSSEKRVDIIQALKLCNSETLVAFCQGMQSGAPVDSFVRPEPSDMPGYDDQVIMAAGAFTMGASIELSADAPLRDPFAVYLQGGLNYHSGKIGILLAAQTMLDRGFLQFVE